MHTYVITYNVTKEVKELKGKKTILVLAALVSLSIPAISTSSSFAIEYEFSAALITGSWAVEGCTLQEIPGAPLIPFRTAQILLPQDAEVKDVKVNPATPVIQTGIDITWGQPPCTLSDTPVKVGKNDKIYNSDKLYPGKLFEVVSVESFRGFQILYVNVYPLQYKPKSKTIKFYPQLTVEVKFGKKFRNTLYRGLADDNQAVSSMVDNPEMVATYVNRPSTTSPFLEPGTYQYVIITGSTLTSTFQTLADWKANYVIGTKIVDINWIYSNYTGYDNAEKVRNFIIDAYNTWGTQWCLLGGDIAVVPYRGFCVEAGLYVDWDMAADMYFGCLDGTFDADGDHIYGETNDDVDWLMEVYVGRAPVETVGEAQTFVNKVITYEQALREAVCQYHQSRLQSGNNPDARQVAWDCEYWTPSEYVKKELFEEDQQVTKQLYQDAWSGAFDSTPNYPPVMFQHAGHGNATLYYINYEVGENVTWYTSDVPSLTNNNFFPVHTSIACICGRFTDDDCLAEEYVKDDCGAIACYMNDNFGWYSGSDASKYSGEFCEMQFRALFSDGKEHLGELLNQSKSYMVSQAESSSVYRWCYYEINLIGDPETPVLTQRGEPPDTVTITNPHAGSEVYGTVAITTYTTGCIDTVEFYIDGEVQYTDSTEPFEWNWDTSTASEDQQHTILVKGYCSGEFTDDDMITVTVNNYSVTITHPLPGETVSGTVLVTTDTRGCDTVEFYIDGELTHTDSTEPFEWNWDTTQYSDGSHTVTAKGYSSSVFWDQDDITCTVDNEFSPYVVITSPQNGQTVSGTVTVTTDTGDVDEVRFYLNNDLKYIDTTEPFEWNWDTTQYKNRNYKLKVEGYSSGTFGGDDEIRVRVSNPSIALLSFVLFFAGIYRR